MVPDGPVGGSMVSVGCCVGVMAVMTRHLGRCHCGQRYCRDFYYVRKADWGPELIKDCDVGVIEARLFSCAWTV